MATGLQFKENLTIISGGYRGEGVGSNGVTQNWTETQGDSGSSTVTYWYHDSAQMTDRNSTLVEVSVTDSWTAVKEADNTYKVTIHSVMNFIRRTKVGSPSALSASIFVRRERGGSNIWTSGGCVNAAASATHATNVDLGTYTITLPPGQSAATHGAIYYRSNICGHDNTNPPSIYVDEYWLGVNFRNTLPPDYRPGQTWSNTGSSVQTVTGTSINVSNTLQSPFEDLKVGGDTEQKTYSGKNLLNITKGTFTQNGITFTQNPDGSVTMNGTSTGNAYYEMNNTAASQTTITSGVKYTLSIGNVTLPSGQVIVQLRKVDPNTIYCAVSDKSASFTAPETTTTFTYIGVYGSGVTLNNVTIYPMLEVGSSMTSFEPYVGGTASPNPNYPQEVQTVTGRQVVTISDGGNESQEYEINLGKNLCDGINQEYWLTSTATGGGVSSDNSGLIIPIEQNTSYTISTTSSQSRYRVAFSDQTYQGSQFNCYNGANRDGTSDSITKNSENHKYLIVNATDLTKIQVERGSTATSFAPYFTPIELCKIGTYQDYIYKSGEDWYVHKETAEMILDGAETITKPFTNIFVVENLSGDWPKESEAIFYYCEDYYRLKSTGSNSNFDTLAADYGYAFDFTSSASGRNVRFKDTRYDNVDDYKTWLATNNVTAYYALAIPTDRQVLEPALIAQLNAIENGGSYTGNTTINVTGDLASPLTVGVRVATGSGTWQSHNRNGGWAGVYNGSTFKEMRTVNGPDGTGDPPTIKHPSGWKNQRKIGLNS